MTLNAYILSGKSAKVAMMYITDYISKDNGEMHQILSLFSHAVAAGAQALDSDAKVEACQLIHHCIAAMI
jgi:hypothetical protein